MYDAGPLRRLLGRHGYLLRPRAVTLTLFIRMTLVDWFVHGVGGAHYERIGDYLFEHYYGRRKPPVAVATCTMMLPQNGSVPYPDDGIAAAQHELRALKHHPERYMPGPLARQEPVATLLRCKRTAVSRAGNRCLPYEQRKSAWLEITRLDAELLPYTTPAADGLQPELVEAERGARSEKVRTHREYFFGLFPEPRLRALKDSVSGQEFLTSHHRPLQADSLTANDEPDSAGPVPRGPDDQSNDCGATSR